MKRYRRRILDAKKYKTVWCLKVFEECKYGSPSFDRKVFLISPFEKEEVQKYASKGFAKRQTHLLWK